MNRCSHKNIRDCVHGDLPFSELETSVMDSYEMQRLRGIKQLGTSYLVYPGAMHTRFEHSLGTNFMAKKIMRFLEERGPGTISPLDHRAIPMAALLHDVTHLPFGHTLEDERRIFPRHDKDPKRLRYFLQDSDIGKKLHTEGVLSRVLELLQERRIYDEKISFPSQIISHTICADLLDYLRRDAQYCGLKLDFDDRIFRYFIVENGKLVINLQKNGLFRHDAFSEIIHLLRFRYFLTERVYYHHAKIAAGAMLSRAVERAVKKGFNTELLFRLSDEALLNILSERYKSDRPINRLMAKYMHRQLYKRCYVLTDYNMDEKTRKRLSDRYHLNRKGERSKAERMLARSARIPLESVIIYAPPPTMNLKEADVLVKIDGGSVTPLNRIQNHEVHSLQEKYGKLWKFYVFIDPEYSQRMSLLADAAKKMFGRPNELELIQKGQLSMFNFPVIN